MASRTNRGKHLDVEHLCSQAVPILRKVCSDNYKQHVCKEIGCEHRAVVIDGNEKNRRKLCAVPAKHIEEKDPSEGKVNYYELCTSSPMLHGGKFCVAHSIDNSGRKAQIIEQSKPGPSPPQQDYQVQTRSLTKKLLKVKVISHSLEEIEDIGCRKSKNVIRHSPVTPGKTYPTTAGIIGQFRTCGIQLGLYEMYTSVS